MQTVNYMYATAIPNYRPARVVHVCVLTYRGMLAFSQSIKNFKRFNGANGFVKRVLWSGVKRVWRCAAIPEKHVQYVILYCYFTYSSILCRLAPPFYILLLVFTFCVPVWEKNPKSKPRDMLENCQNTLPTQLTFTYNIRLFEQGLHSNDVNDR